MARNAQIAEPHCENCGRVNPTTHDSYTVCCNELVCFGFPHEWVNENGKRVAACCGSKADEAYDAIGQTGVAYWQWTPDA